MEKTCCLCCGVLMKSKILDTTLICGDCDGNLSKEVFSKKINDEQRVVRPFSHPHGYWR